MANESVKAGVKVTREAAYIGDFKFNFQGNLIEKYIEMKDAGKLHKYEKEVMELMAKHYAFYGQFQEENEYVTKGSILRCSGGNKMITFDILNDHGVEKAGSPLGICTDCKANENIHTFGECKKPTPEGYPERPIVIPTLKSKLPFIMHKCIPILNGSWSKTKSSKVKIWDESVGKYVDAITTGDFLVCLYGGIIEVVEIPTVNGTKGSGQIADKYYASERLKIRATPYGQQIDGNRVFIPGAIVKVHESKETQKVDGSDSTWIKVYYDVNKIGWVGKELLAELPSPVTGHNFQYNWGKSQYVTQDFKDKAAGVAKALNIDPDNLMAVMAFESGFNPAQKNMGGGSATGLVQFMPTVAEELHTTTTALATMSGVEQLDYVFGYFYPYKGQLGTLGDVYMRVLWPDAIGQSDNYILYSKGSTYYAANAGLDGSVDGIVDGNVTKKEAVQAVIDKRQEYV
ncbi:PAAR-like protein [Lacrimispora sp.]|uniref:PAAR-like protein n=1 Tax=Lacrimispora sp. TaxID=2719234 RepID=UPI00289AB898|nr:PAAR-like protein [Lacrimispora sp.]